MKETASAPLFSFSQAALAYACGAPAENAFAAQAAGTFSAAAESSAFPSAAGLEAVLAQAQAAGPDAADTARRLVSLSYALAAALPLPARLAWPAGGAGPRLAALCPDRPSREPLLAILGQLEGLCRSCAALPNGSFRLLEADGPLLHFERRGGGEILNAVYNTSPHPLLVQIGGKAVEANPFGYTLTVREEGHSADHSYYDVT